MSLSWKEEKARIRELLAEQGGVVSDEGLHPIVTQVLQESGAAGYGDGARFSVYMVAEIINRENAEALIAKLVNATEELDELGEEYGLDGQVQEAAEQKLIQAARAALPALELARVDSRKYFS